MTNQDKRLLEACISGGEALIKDGVECSFPLDEETIKCLNELNKNIQMDADDYEIFKATPHNRLIKGSV